MKRKQSVSEADGDGYYYSTPVVTSRPIPDIRMIELLRAATVSAIFHGQYANGKPRLAGHTPGEEYVRAIIARRRSLHHSQGGLTAPDGSQNATAP